MKQIQPDLWQTAPEHPFPDFPRVSTHAYLLVRDGGNVLFYSSGHVADDRDVRELGGIARQYLSHRDEAGPPLVRIRETFGPVLCCHRLEEAAVRKACPVDLTFDRRETHPGGIEVIPTPGHTPGSTCFLVQSPHGKTYLFTGDTIFPNDDAWETLVLDVGSKSDLKESLRLLRGLEPDLVISSASVGDVAFKEMSAGEWREAVDGALRALS